MGDYNWAEIIKGTRALNYSLRSFEAFFAPEEKKKAKGLCLPDTYLKNCSRTEWLERCNRLEQKTIQIFTPELMAPFKFSSVQADFTYGLIKPMRVPHPVSNAKLYQFEFDLAQRKVSYFGMDLIDYAREIHTDGERLFDVFEANGWKFAEQH